ncbi:uncharacterized protein V1516DRAFT_680768 [Lipomyces oligophaga]|uniref:uncharacterized protein n=1 Tax=Lipomyces oligophaga TaxID=45792 RepID=UPI0034CEDF62
MAERDGRSPVALGPKYDADGDTDSYNDMRDKFELIDRWINYDDPRLEIPTILRLPGIFLFSSFVTLPMGAYRGGKVAALRFLAENSHRLPTAVQGWYWYHKRKNYVIMHSAMKESASFTLRTFAFLGCMFGAEAVLDAVRGRIDFLNTMVATTATGFAYAFRKQIPFSQVRNTMKYGAKVGLAFGLLQDVIRAYQGQLWYYNRLADKFDLPKPEKKHDTMNLLSENTKQMLRRRSEN